MIKLYLVLSALFFSLTLAAQPETGICSAIREFSAASGDLAPIASCQEAPAFACQARNNSGDMYVARRFNFREGLTLMAKNLGDHPGLKEAVAKRVRIPRVEMASLSEFKLSIPSKDLFRCTNSGKMNGRCVVSEVEGHIGLAINYQGSGERGRYEYNEGGQKLKNLSLIVTPLNDGDETFKIELQFEMKLGQEPVQISLHQEYSQKHCQ